MIICRVLRRVLRRKEDPPGTSSLECGCCFGDVALSEVVQCTEGDLFCVACLRHYAEESVFGSFCKVSTHLDFPCMSSAGSEACLGTFPDSQLRKALTVEQHEKLAQKAAVAAARSADIELYSCPKCGVAAEVGPISLPSSGKNSPSAVRCFIERTRRTRASGLVRPTLFERGGNAYLSFECPQKGCAHKCCRNCHKPPHTGKNCEEEDPGGGSPKTAKRRKVEEAMTKARLRTCPKCAASFFKYAGCNKVKCACGQSVCYVCREAIVNGHAHFINPLGKCKMFSNNEVEDRKAMRKAAAVANGGELPEETPQLTRAPQPSTSRAPKQSPSWFSEFVFTLVIVILYNMFLFLLVHLALLRHRARAVKYAEDPP